MKSRYLILFALSICATLKAQDSISTVRYKCGNVSPRYKAGHIFDLSLSAGSGDAAAALQWAYLHGFGHKKQRFKVGYGIRYTGYIGADKLYTTAPSKYTSTKQSLGTIFSETIAENIDTLSVYKTSQINSFNVSVHLQYSVGWRNQLDLGFNIDAIGYSFGSEKQGTIVSSVLDESSAPVQYAKPTALNLLLTSDNDIGSLNSEFYLRYWFSKRIAVKAGFTFYFAEYQTYNKVSFDNGRILNDRFRYKSSMAMLGVCWKPFR